jgi:hypothetical protein
MIISLLKNVMIISYIFYPLYQQTAKKIWPRDNNWSGSEPDDDSGYTKTDVMCVLKEFHIKAVAEDKELTERAHPYYIWKQGKLGWLEAQLAKRAAKKEAKAKKAKANRKRKALPTGAAQRSRKNDTKKSVGTFRSPQKARSKYDDESEPEVTRRSPQGSRKNEAKKQAASFCSPQKARNKGDDESEREVTRRSPRFARKPEEKYDDSDTEQSASNNDEVEDDDEDEDENDDEDEDENEDEDEDNE